MHKSCSNTRFTLRYSPITEKNGDFGAGTDKALADIFVLGKLSIFALRNILWCNGSTTDSGLFVQVQVLARQHN